MLLEDRLKEIVNYLNNNHYIASQHTNKVLRYCQDTAISFWECGAIVCIGARMCYIQEDDSYWFYCTSENGECGCKSSSSLSWGLDIATAITRLYEYVKEVGYPYNYANSDAVCGYELVEDSHNWIYI